MSHGHRSFFRKKVFPALRQLSVKACGVVDESGAHPILPRDFLSQLEQLQVDTEHDNEELAMPISPDDVPSEPPLLWHADADSGLVTESYPDTSPRFSACIEYLLPSVHEIPRSRSPGRQTPLASTAGSPSCCLLYTSPSPRDS